MNLDTKRRQKWYLVLPKFCWRFVDAETKEVFSILWLPACSSNDGPACSRGNNKDSGGAAAGNNRNARKKAAKEKKEGNHGKERMNRLDDRSMCLSINQANNQTRKQPKTQKYV